MPRPYRRVYEAPEAKRARMRDHASRWRRDNPIDAKVNRQNSRAAGLGIGGRVEPEEWRARVEEFDARCGYCNEKCVIEMDHFRPLSKGGDHTLDNVIPACQACNAKKGSKLIFEWVKDLV